MKQIKMVLLFFLVLGLMACSHEPAKQTVQLAGNVKTSANQSVMVYGQSNLPEKAVVTGQLLDLKGKKVHVKETAKTDKDGSFTLEMERPDIEQEYQLQVIFNPEEQDQNVQKTYGKKGENIKEDSEGFVQKINDTDISGIVMYDHIAKIITKGPVGTGPQSTELSKTFDIIPDM